MREFRGKVAVVTGGASGMGRELARQLVAAGARVAICDVSVEGMEETRRSCAPEPAIHSFRCDVSRESEVLAFRDAVAAELHTDHVDLLFNNAGIGGGGSFVVDERSDWERTFDICWLGVYYCTRAFLPLLLASRDAHIVNTSSVNGFWATLGPGIPHTAYSAAKFAVRGFSEALLTDLRLNAPQVKVSVVMPGHIGTSIAINSRRVLGKAEPLEMPSEEVQTTRRRLQHQGLPVTELTDDEIRRLAWQRGQDFRDLAPVTSEEAATAILDGVKAERWRILVGEDAVAIDRLVRECPEEAYEPEFFGRLLASGHFGRIAEPTPKS